MHKKGSMELSVNSIVILVIAIVMMGLILGFIRSKFQDITPDLASEEPAASAASAAEPITLSRTEISMVPAKSKVLKVNVYNSGTQDSDNTSLVGSCGTNKVTFQPTTPKNIPPTEQAEYILTFKAEKTAAKGDLFLCNLRLSSKENSTSKYNYSTIIMPKDFVIKIE